MGVACLKQMEFSKNTFPYWSAYRFLKQQFSDHQKVYSLEGDTGMSLEQFYYEFKLSHTSKKIHWERPLLRAIKFNTNASWVKGKTFVWVITRYHFFNVIDIWCNEVNSNPIEVVWIFTIIQIAKDASLSNVIIDNDNYSMISAIKDFIHHASADINGMVDYINEYITILHSVYLYYAL